MSLLDQCILVGIILGFYALVVVAMVCIIEATVETVKYVRYRRRQRRNGGRNEA